MKHWILFIFLALFAWSCGGDDAADSDDSSDDDDDNNDDDNDNDDNDNDDNDNNDNNDNNNNNDDDNDDASDDDDDDTDDDDDDTETADDDDDNDTTDDDDDNDDTDTSTSTDTSNFSFFVISIDSIREQCGNQEGCGGDLGGLDGADDMCQYAAEQVGAGNKEWKAFISVTDYNGTGPVNAIDRVGEGPWYNVDGLLLAENKAGLLNLRPDGDATTIVYTSGFQDWPFNQCLTDEFGECVLSYGDSHDTITGSNRQGTLINTNSQYTCNDWTSTSITSQIPIGHSWPRQLNGTQEDSCHWIYAHQVNGCGVNINLENTMEQGIGGDGGYGGFYCFADLAKQN